MRIVTDWWDASSSSQLPNGTAKTIFTLNLPNIIIILLNFGLNKWAELPSLSGKGKKKDNGHFHFEKAQRSKH